MGVMVTGSISSLLNLNDTSNIRKRLIFQVAAQLCGTRTQLRTGTISPPGQVTAEIKRFRLLIIGKTGCGKTTILRKVIVLIIRIQCSSSLSCRRSVVKMWFVLAFHRLTSADRHERARPTDRAHLYAFVHPVPRRH